MMKKFKFLKDNTKPQFDIETIENEVIIFFRQNLRNYRNSEITTLHATYKVERIGDVGGQINMIIYVYPLDAPNYRIRYSVNNGNAVPFILDRLYENI